MNPRARNGLTLGAIADMIQDLGDKTEETARTVVEISTQMGIISRSMQEPGQDSLPTKVRLLEEALSDVRAQLARAESRRWQVYLALISSLAAPFLAWFMATHGP